MSSFKYCSANAAYIAFGVLHELSHFLSGWFIGISDWKDIGNSATWCDIFLRKYTLHDSEGVTSFPIWKVYFVQHFGWISTVLLALLYRKFASREGTINDANRWILLAAYLTAIDALSSDLFLINPFRSLPSDGTKVFFCGNFGIITLNAAWYLDKGEKVLDVLEKMVQVTMMRGAQTGGVVTFSNEKQILNQKRSTSMIGHRTRCVKTKRGDLSVQIRNSVQPMIMPVTSIARMSIKVHNAYNKKNLWNPNDIGRFFAGHTRFATSSVADLAGCHPHQWSKPHLYSVYDFSDTNPHFKPKKQNVENFISHNGDFEYFNLNGQTIHGDTVIDWLEHALGTAKPAAVDSIGIAGLVDIIRCSGCFALSIRYVICLGLPSSSIDMDSDVANYPSLHDYEALGKIFEEALDHFSRSDFSTYTLEQIRSDPTLRQNLVKSVIEFVLARKGCMKVFSVYVDDDGLGESIPTVTHFVEKVFDAFFDNDLMQTVKVRFLLYFSFAF